MSDHRLKNFAKMGERLIHGALADGSYLDQVLLGIQENNPERFAIEEAHFGAKVCDCDRAIDRERLTFLPKCHGAHTKRTDES